MSKLFLALFLSGIPSVVSVLANVTALKMTKNSGALTIIGFSRVVMGYLVSLLAYNEVQNPVCTLGVVLVVFGVSATIYFKE